MQIFCNIHIKYSVIIIVLWNKEIILLQEGGHLLAGRGADVETEGGDQQDFQQGEMSRSAGVWPAVNIKTVSKMMVSFQGLRPSEVKICPDGCLNSIL